MLFFIPYFVSFCPIPLGQNVIILPHKEMKNGNAAANRFGCGAMEKPKNLKLKFMKKEITKFLSANRISLAFIALTLPWGGVKSQKHMGYTSFVGTARLALHGDGCRRRNIHYQDVDHKQ